MSEPSSAPIGAWATRYAQCGLSVFPACTINDGRCSCGKASCHSPGKHPIGSLVPHGVLEATTDLGTIAQWWAIRPDANVGVATGDASSIVVVDVDTEGEDTLEHLKRLHGALDATWMAATGSGGIHLYYRMPLVEVRNSAGAIGPGIDVRGNGGYVIAPPSLHVSGGVYEWDDIWHPRLVTITEVPDWLLKKMTPIGQSRSPSPSGQPRASVPLPHVLKEGMRNSWLTSAAGTMRRRGFSQNAITAALKVENRERCKPPLDDQEVERIAWSIVRYAPAEASRDSA